MQTENYQRITQHAEGMSLRYGVIVLRNLTQPPTKKSFYHQGFFAVKRRAVFILGAMWWALVRGWRKDCVVGGMETRFQWRKAHSRTAKCEAFHFAPRLFFMFLFFWFHSRFGNNAYSIPRNFPQNRNNAKWWVRNKASVYLMRCTLVFFLKCVGILTQIGH